MIISHRYRYLFLELPHTGSTAVSQELREHYAGEKIHGKHAPYHYFARTASEDEKSYFTFAAVRDPLDVVVTKYVKYVTDHLGRYTDPIRVARNRGLGNWIDRRIQREIVQRDLEFSDYFLKFYRFPFNTWACLDHNKFDFVMKFENLQDDFSRVLDRIGITQVRPLPVVNSSAGKADFRTYYSQEAIARAKKVFAGYMDEWEYRFPDEWGQPEYSLVDRAKYRMATAPMKVYWRYLKQYLFSKKREPAAPQDSSMSG